MLTDLAVKGAKPGPKLKKLSDGGGLQLWVFPDGAKRWRLAYRFADKQKSLALGVYPEIALKDARDARDEARRLLGTGRDPSVEKKLDKATKAVSAANTFGIIADELLHKKKKEGKAPRTLEKVEWLLDLVRRFRKGCRPWRSRRPARNRRSLAL